MLRYLYGVTLNHHISLVIVSSMSMRTLEHRVSSGHIISDATHYKFSDSITVN